MAKFCEENNTCGGENSSRSSRVSSERFWKCAVKDGQFFGDFGSFIKQKPQWIQLDWREPKIIENKSIGCGLQVSHWDGDSNLQQERATHNKDHWFAYTRHKIQRLVWRILVSIRKIFKWKKPQEFYFAKLQRPFQFKTITTTLLKKFPLGWGNSSTSFFAAIDWNTISIHFSIRNLRALANTIVKLRGGSWFGISGYEKPRFFLFMCMLLLLIFFLPTRMSFLYYFVVLFPYLFVSLFACLFAFLLVSSLAKLNGRKRRDQWKEVPCSYHKRGVIHYTHPHHKRSINLFFYFFFS